MKKEWMTKKYEFIWKYKGELFACNSRVLDVKVVEGYGLALVLENSVINAEWLVAVHSL